MLQSAFGASFVATPIVEVGGVYESNPRFDEDNEDDAAGLVLDRLVEWGPTAEAVEARPGLADDLHRPWFLLLRATKPGG